jgi:prolyl-tRNA synthetase
MEEAESEVRKMLNIYKDLAENLLAIPVITGVKSESEKFPGAVYTSTVEGLMPDGRALQMGTSHNLGQHFAKAFEIMFSDKDGESKHVWQTCWGASTRLIGAVVMVHGDDRGLVLPPKIAPVQAVIIPILFKNTEQNILKKCEEIRNRLDRAGFRVKMDDRDHSPGFKFNEWELRGVPLRLEIGPKDLERDQVTAVRRDDGKKEFIKTGHLAERIAELMEDMQSALFNKAKKFLDDHTFDVDNEKDFARFVGKGMIRANWCGSVKCENALKETGATIRCIPFDYIRRGKCIHCGTESSIVTYFAKAY